MSGRLEPTSCLVIPSLQLLSIADEFLAIATAFEAGDASVVLERVRALDLDACRTHWTDCAAEARARYRPISDEVPKPAALPKPAVTDEVRLRLGERDGWRCRFCSIPLTWNGFFHALWKVEGLDVGNDVNDLWRVFCLSPDHVRPVSKGGSGDPANLVSACGSCNYARSDALLGEIGIVDPFGRDPIRTTWTGLVGRPHLGVLG